MQAHQKIENRTYVQFSNFSPGYLSKENKNTNLKMYMYPSIHDELWNEVYDIAQDTGIKTIPMEKK